MEVALITAPSGVTFPVGKTTVLVSPDGAELQRGFLRDLRAARDYLRAGGLTLLVDAGDLFQGTPLTYLAAAPNSRRPHPVMAAMSVMRRTVSNWRWPFLRR